MKPKTLIIQEYGVDVLFLTNTAGQTKCFAPRFVHGGNCSRYRVTLSPW